MAAVAAVLLIVSTFGPLSMVEAAMVLTALGVLALLRARAVGRRFHLPIGDGTVMLLAAGWYAVLILVRVLDRPLGQSALALVCAAVLAAAGLRERALRPADDFAPPPPAEPEPASDAPTVAVRPDEEKTELLHDDQDATAPLPPTDPRPPGPAGPPRPR